MHQVREKRPSGAKRSEAFRVEVRRQTQDFQRLACFANSRQSVRRKHTCLAMQKLQHAQVAEWAQGSYFSDGKCL